MLGGAVDALYLREPITQSHPEINRRVVFDPVDHPDLEPDVRRLADRAFMGWPDFDERVVRFPEQWALRRRRSRRVVIKEVNPMACGWFLRRYRPRVIFLLRHLAAVATSAQRERWLGPSPEDWARRGSENGTTLREAWAALEGYPARETVFYESLCADPVEGFRRLFGFAGLRWDASSVRRVIEASRDSRRKIDSWRSEARPEAVEALRSTYRSYELAWYQRDDEW
jgi:hypothetical protein